MSAPTREEVLADVATYGYFALYDSEYAVVPLDEYVQQERALLSMQDWARAGEQFAIDWHRRWGVPLPDGSDE